MSQYSPIVSDKMDGKTSATSEYQDLPRKCEERFKMYDRLVEHFPVFEAELYSSCRKMNGKQIQKKRGKGLSVLEATVNCYQLLKIKISANG